MLLPFTKACTITPVISDIEKLFSNVNNYATFFNWLFFFLYGEKKRTFDSMKLTVIPLNLIYLPHLLILKYLNVIILFQKKKTMWPSLLSVLHLKSSEGLLIHNRRSYCHILLKIMGCWREPLFHAASQNNCSKDECKKPVLDQTPEHSP